ncbi:MAG: HU family DNA-binding protein, partial [Candidatus Pacebacteria bacterium]|nr:HU family DNA-binding protein [Candidatus Paceibacterota bacterium]
MKKDNMVEIVQDQLKVTKKDAENVVNTLIEQMISTLKKGEDITISGFGTFVVKHQEARMGVNPKTGEKIRIAAKKAVKFRAAKGL